MKRILSAIIVSLFSASCFAATTNVTTRPGGSNRGVQFNDGGVFNSSGSFQFNKTTNVVTVPTMTVSGQLTIGTTIPSSVVRVSTPVGGSYPGSFMRFDLDGETGGSFLPQGEILSLYSGSSGNAMAKRGSISALLIPGGGSNFISFRNESDTSVHTFGFRDSDSGASGYIVGTKGQVFGNSLNVRGAVGYGGIYVQGSTTPTNYTYYMMNASSGPAQVTLPSAGAIAGIYGRTYRICKTDSSTNTVQININHSSGTTINYQGECIDYWSYVSAESLSGGGSAVWYPIGRSFWNDVSASTVTASSITASVQIQTPTLKFADGTTMTTASGSGSGPFTNATSSTSIDMNGYAINNSSAVTTSSMSVTGATVTVNGVTYNFPPQANIGTSTSQRLFAYNPTTYEVEFPEAITDGLRAGGVVGSTYTMTAAIIYSGSVTAPSGSTVDGAGKIGYDPTDGVYVGHDGTAPYIVGQATSCWSVTISTPPGGWNGAAIPLETNHPNMATTYKRIRGTVMDGTSVTFNLEERPYGSLGSAGTDVMSSDLAADTTGEERVVFSNASIAADAHLVLAISAVSGSPNYLVIQGCHQLAVE